MDRYNKYQTKQYTHAHTHTHTAQTLVGDQYLAGWPPRKTIRSSESMRNNRISYKMNVPSSYGF